MLVTTINECKVKMSSLMTKGMLLILKMRSCLRFLGKEQDWISFFKNYWLKRIEGKIGERGEGWSVELVSENTHFYKGKR